MLLAGAIGAGKTTVAQLSIARWNWSLIAVRQALSDVLAVNPTDRATLQERGAELDRRTNGRWLVEYIEFRIEESRGLVVDSLRTQRQTVPILERISGSLLVYLDARPETRRARFESSRLADPVKRSLDFSEATRHPTELEVASLRPMADLVIETDGLTADEVVAEIESAAFTK